MSEGPTILWGLLKSKRVKTSDGKDLGKIDKVSQNYIRLEKGRVKKDKFGCQNTMPIRLTGKYCGF
jgi:hypothetical protein